MRHTWDTDLVPCATCVVDSDRPCGHAWCPCRCNTPTETPTEPATSLDPLVLLIAAATVQTVSLLILIVAVIIHHITS